MRAMEVRTPAEFEQTVLRAREPTVVLFWAAWCPFCQAFRPVFDAAVRNHDARFAVVDLDDQDNPLWDAYRVNVVPSLAFFRNGALVARKDGRLMRGLSKDDLDAFLDQVKSTAAA